MTNFPIAVIREACIRANPEINMCQRCENGVPIHSDFCKDGLAHLIVHRKVRLADVLLAYKESKRGEVLGQGKRETMILRIVYKWDLKKDSLESQSPETLSFLSSLLGKE